MRKLILASMAGVILAHLVGCSDDDDDNAAPSVPAVALLLFVGNQTNGDIVQFTDEGTSSLYHDSGAGGFFSMMGMAYDPANGDLYFSNKANDGRIYKVDRFGTETLFADPTPQSAKAIAFSPAGLLHAATNGPVDGQIIQYDALGNPTVVHTMTGSTNFFFGLTFDSTGTMYYTDNAAVEIRQVTGPTTSTIFADGVVDQVGDVALVDPFDIEFDAQDRLLIADASIPSPTVWRFTAANLGSAFLDASDGLTGPVGLAIDKNVTGDVFVSMFGPHEVRRFSSTGSPLAPIPFGTAADGLDFPRDIVLNR